MQLLHTLFSPYIYFPSAWNLLTYAITTLLVSLVLWKLIEHFKKESFFVTFFQTLWNISLGAFVGVLTAFAYPISDESKTDVITTVNATVKDVQDDMIIQSGTSKDKKAIDPGFELIALRTDILNKHLSDMQKKGYLNIVDESYLYRTAFSLKSTVDDFRKSSTYKDEGMSKLNKLYLDKVKIEIADLKPFVENIKDNPQIDKKMVELLTTYQEKSKKGYVTEEEMNIMLNQILAVHQLVNDHLKIKLKEKQQATALKMTSV
ncbi:TPA: hypothetical protein ACGIK9_003345 [Acinetobacter baumannii]|uniref:hypothetical protein n=1 Tax=Acinetobacter baumannii TaxID=470 RepID=UPI00338FF942